MYCRNKKGKKYYPENKGIEEEAIKKALVDLRLDNKIDEKIYEDKYLSLQDKYLEKSKEKENLEFNLKNENIIKKMKYWKILIDLFLKAL